MNIPNKVRIGSADYEVKQEDETITINSVQCKGMIDYEYHEIKIDTSIQDKQGMEQTFLHELVHGIVRERSLDLQNSDDETIVDEIAMGLHQVIRDNIKIFCSDDKLVLNTSKSKIVLNDGEMLSKLYALTEEMATNEYIPKPLRNEFSQKLSEINLSWTVENE